MLEHYIKCIMQLTRFTYYEFASKCIRKDYIFKRKNQERYWIIFQKGKVVDLYQGENTYYIIMELLKGETLYQFTKKAQLNIFQIKSIMSKTQYFQNQIQLKQLKLQILDQQFHCQCLNVRYMEPLVILHQKCSLININTGKVDILVQVLGDIFRSCQVENLYLVEIVAVMKILKNNKRQRCNNPSQELFQRYFRFVEINVVKRSQKKNSPEQTLLYSFFDDTIQGELGVADQSLHEIVRAFPLIQPMQITNSKENISDTKIFKQSSEVNPVLSKVQVPITFLRLMILIKIQGMGSDHIIE
ncbi:unnamed protein product [Paramecium octaurelia]|uniref:Uncharacterized protein n=1 Tax=Paramecium octaurelia TaxID=43137 RepID=A0A8S1W2T7_PAROT|nr:unnamed protein product [Paramecium octaurelia]